MLRLSPQPVFPARIGMNMLSRLKSWSVENGEMVLTP